MIKKISFIAIWVVMAVFLLPGGMASFWQDSLSVKGRIVTGEWIRNDSVQTELPSKLNCEPEFIDPNFTGELDEIKSDQFEVIVIDVQTEEIDMNEPILQEPESESSDNQEQEDDTMDDSETLKMIID